MKYILAWALASAALVLCAERQPFDRYQSVVDRGMFGSVPPGFDPTKPMSAAVLAKNSKAEAEKEKEVEKIKSSIRLSMVNVNPNGETCVGFTDSSNPKEKVSYYLKVGETRNGWLVKEADPTNATMTIQKEDIEVSLSIGTDSSKDGSTTRVGDGAMPAPHAETKLLKDLKSRKKFRQALLRQEEEREAAEKKRQEEERAAKEAERAAEKAKQEAEKDEIKAELAGMREEVRKSREETERLKKDAAEKAKAAEENTADEKEDDGKIE